MESRDLEKNPLDVDELIRQARGVMKRWRKPSHEQRPSVKSWQELMDGRIYRGKG